MPSSPKSPYATSFKAAIKRGTPAGQAVASIAKRTGKNRYVIYHPKLEGLGAGAGAAARSVARRAR